MPLDPTIVLRGLPPPTPLQSPLEALQLVEQLRDRREQGEARRAALDERRQAGEERRAAAQEAAAKRQREAQIEQTLQEAMTFDASGQPTVDWAKLTGHVPAAVQLDVRKAIDDATTRTATLQTANLTRAQKIGEYLGAVARPVKAGHYDKKLFDLAAFSARNAGALTQEQLDAALAVTDPAQIQAAVDGAIALAGGEKAELQKITTVDAEGREVTQFVTPTEGASYPVAPPKPPTPAYQQKDVLLDGKPAIVTFDSHSGKSFLGTQDVTARVRPIPPQGPGPEPIVSVIGPDGKPIYVTRSQALGKTPGGAADAPGGIKLTAGQQDDLATMLTVQQLAADATTLGTKTGWAGVGPWQGRVGATMLGSGGTEGETLRNTIGNIKGTIAKLRGGTSFTPNEQALLESYTPTETDPDWKIQAKLASMVDFIEKKRANTLRVARGEYTLPATATGTATTTTGTNPFRK